MRKSAIVIVFSLLAVFFLVSVIQAASPSLIGTWKATVPKSTATACSTNALTVTIKGQCGNLIRGTISFAGKAIPVVGKIIFCTTHQVYEFSLNGNATYTNGNAYINIGGDYSTSPNIRINCDYFGFSSYSNGNPDWNNVAFDNFPLIKQ